MMKPDEECDLVTVQFLVPRKGRNLNQVRWDSADVLNNQLSYVFNIVEMESLDKKISQDHDGEFVEVER
jgi:hypothetical protein